MKLTAVSSYVFTLYGHGGHLGHVTWTVKQTFVSPSHVDSIWNLIGQTVSEEKMFK